MKLWMSNLVRLHSWSCFKQEGWTRWPPKSLPTWIILWFFYNGDGHWHQNISWPDVRTPSQEAGSAHLCVKERKNTYFLFSLSPAGFTFSHLCLKKMQLKCLLGNQILSAYIQSVLSDYRPLRPFGQSYLWHVFTSEKDSEKAVRLCWVSPEAQLSECAEFHCRSTWHLWNLATSSTK